MEQGCLRQLTSEWPESMLSVIFAIDLNPIGLDRVVIGSRHDSESHIFVAVEDESVKGADTVMVGVRAKFACHGRFATYAPSP